MGSRCSLQSPDRDAIGVEPTIQACDDTPSGVVAATAVLSFAAAGAEDRAYIAKQTEDAAPPRQDPAMAEIEQPAVPAISQQPMGVPAAAAKRTLCSPRQEAQTSEPGLQEDQDEQQQEDKQQENKQQELQQELQQQEDSEEQQEQQKEQQQQQQQQQRQRQQQKKEKQKEQQHQKQEPQQHKQPNPSKQPPQDREAEKRRAKLKARLEANRRKKEEIEVKMEENRQLVEDILAGKYKDKPRAGSAPGGSLLIKMPTPADRENMRKIILGQFRAQYAKLGRHDSCPSAAVATNQYSAAESQGLQIAGGHRSMPRPRDVALPATFRKAVGQLSAEQLAKFDCNNCRKLLSVYGEIFDVSDRPDKYGIDGPYSWMAGNDITWGFVSGKDVPETVNKYYDLWKVAPEGLRDSKLRLIYGWVAWYEYEYGTSVGVLKEYVNEAGLKGPPIEEAEECAIM